VNTGPSITVSWAQRIGKLQNDNSRRFVGINIERGEYGERQTLQSVCSRGSKNNYITAL
jgi:hypothetical protein